MSGVDLHRATEAAFLPNEQLPAIALLVGASFGAALLALVVLKLSSDQRAIAARKRLIRAAILELLLFNDDWRALARSQREILRHNLGYIWLWVMPLIWMTLPFLLLMSQLEGRLRYEGLAIGRPALVTVKVDQGAPAGESITLATPPAIRLDHSGVWFPSTSEMIFTITPLSPGSSSLIVHAGDQRLTKDADASTSLRLRDAQRSRTGWWGTIFTPGEPPLPRTTHVQSITVSYPTRAFHLGGGWSFGWLPLFLALTTAFTLALKQPLGVEF